MKKIFLILASLLWLGFWWWWYTCKICTTCGCSKTEINIPATISPESGVLLFNLNDSNALTQPGWAAYRDSLSSILSSNQKIEIEGQYLSEELNRSAFENLGFARANSIKQLFPDSLQKRISLTSLQVNKRPSMVYPFLASTINLKNNYEKIEQVGDKTLIYFKNNSDQRIQDPEIEKYLAGIASQHKELRSIFNITGHTDNIGDPSANIKLGQLRADAIKNYLMSKGIEKDRIITKSVGESLPLVDNNTPEGRQKNRRTEIEIIQKQ